MMPPAGWVDESRARYLKGVGRFPLEVQSYSVNMVTTEYVSIVRLRPSEFNTHDAVVLKRQGHKTPGAAMKVCEELFNQLFLDVPFEAQPPRCAVVGCETPYHETARASIATGTSGVARYVYLCEACRAATYG